MDKKEKAMKPKPSDLGSGAAAKAAKAAQSRNARTKAGADDALKAFRASLGTKRRD